MTRHAEPTTDFSLVVAVCQLTGHSVTSLLAVLVPEKHLNRKYSALMWNWGGSIFDQWERNILLATYRELVKD